MQLQIYDVGAIDIVGLHTNIWVSGFYFSIAGREMLTEWRRGTMGLAAREKQSFSMFENCNMHFGVKEIVYYYAVEEESFDTLLICFSCGLIWCQVFPMLGVFYSVVGVLQLVLDKYFARKGNLPTADLQKVVFSFMYVVAVRTFWLLALRPLL